MTQQGRKYPPEVRPKILVQARLVKRQTDSGIRVNDRIKLGTEMVIDINSGTEIAALDAKGMPQIIRVVTELTLDGGHVPLECVEPFV